MNWRRWLGLLLTFVVSGVFLFLAFRGIDFVRVGRALRRVHLAWLGLSVVAQAGAFVAMSLRSKILMQPLCSLSFGRLFKSVMVSFTGNNVLPLRMGELLRVDYLARHGEVPHSACLAVVVFERLLDLFWLLLLFFVVLPLVMVESPSGAALLLPAAVIASAILGALWMSRFPELFLQSVQWFTRFAGEPIARFLNDKITLFVRGLSALGSLRSVLAVLGLTGVFWLCYISTVQWWLLAFDIPVAPWSVSAALCIDPSDGCSGVLMATLILPWFAPLLIQVFLSFGAALPSSPGFVGTYHYFATVALMSLGLGHSLAASFAIVGHAISVIPFTIIGLLLLARDYAELSRSFRRSLASEEAT